MQTGAVLIPFFQQFTGINTIMFYATELFDVLGDGANSALLDTAIVGAVNVGSTILAIVLVDRYMLCLQPIAACQLTVCHTAHSAFPLYLTVQRSLYTLCIAVCAALIMLSVQC